MDIDPSEFESQFRYYNIIAMNDKNKYNDEPVFYCKKCLSLAIKSDIDDYDYCNECGSTDIDTDTVDNWEAKYKNMYGFSLLNKNKYYKDR